jgi:uncharacterized protein (TIGR02996 family)
VTDTERGLLNAILERPGDDVARIIYAGYLEDEAGQPERAEFIRLQCELAGMLARQRRDCVGTISGELESSALRKRERELMSPGRWNYPGLGWTLSGFREGMGNGQPVAFWERGFIAEVRAPLAVLVGGECQFGWGPLPGNHEDCTRCHGTGRIPGIAAKIAREQPCEKWVATDKEPFRYMSDQWLWWRGDVESHPESNLPPKVFDCLEAWADRDDESKSYPDKQAALDALSDAIAALAKQENAR